MGKRFDGLYPAVYDFENLYRAYLRARRNKRYRDEVLRFSADLEANLIILQNELMYRVYRPGRWREFYVCDPKKRLIMAPCFRDRVVHHALVGVIEPIFDARFIYDSYACRKGKGTHAAANRLTHFLRSAKERWSRVYCLKADVAQYFPSIRHEILLGLVRQRISDDGVLWLLETILGSTFGDREPRVGVPIGALTSQLMANVYLDRLDQFVKHELRARYYLRYMDDFLLLHGSKTELWRCHVEIERFLRSHLGLSLNGKTAIFPVGQGIDFVGYRIWHNRRLLRRRNIRAAKARFKWLSKAYTQGRVSLARVKASAMSWLGYCRHANASEMAGKVLAHLTLHPRPAGRC